MVLGKLFPISRFKVPLLTCIPLPGADVTHPSPGSLAPSIAAVVGSMNRQITIYGTAIRVQSSRLEVIAPLADMVEQVGLDSSPSWCLVEW